MRSNLQRLALALFILLFAAGSLMAQPAETSEALDDYLPDLKNDQEMQISGLTQAPFSLSYGGWLTPSIIDQRNGTTLSTLLITAKLWVRSSLWKNSYVYFRGKNNFLQVLDKENVEVDETQDVIDLDVGFISMGFFSNKLQLALGRKFYIIGNGLVLNGRGDGGEIDYFSRSINIKLLGMYTGYLNKDSNPYGLSTKDLSDGAERLFVGMSIEKPFGNQALYFLALGQFDYGDDDDDQKSKYYSQYWGAGLKGLVIDGMDYYGEVVIETGKSYTVPDSSNEQEKKNITAMAALLGINYFLKTSYKPAILFQYAYGSGDKDKSLAQDPAGNTSGDDEGFINFGTYVGGYALRPVLSNLHIFRLGFTAVPFEKSSKLFLKRMSTILKYSYYMKDEPEGFINYGEATKNSRDVGHGIDLALRWSVFYDFAVFANYAVFIPGGAYESSESAKHFIMAGFNLIF